MIPDADLSHLTDEEYLLYQAKENKGKDPYADKSWLITAQIIFPKNFKIQFEIYQIAKEEKNVKEAASCLSNIFSVFPHEPELRKELDSIMATLCDNNASPGNQFYSKIFSLFPKDVQKAIILSAAERAKDTMAYCSLMLLFTSNFPESTAYNGLKLMDALIKAEKPGQSPLNPYRDKLICELLPQLLRAEGLEVRPKILYQLLTKAIEFYVAYATASPRPGNASLQSDIVIDEPWHDLFSAVRLIGWNLGWELASDFDTVGNRELILQKIQSFVDTGARVGGKGDSGEDLREVLFTTITIFLHSLLDYTRRLYQDFSHDDSSNYFPPPLTLIEAFTKPEFQEHSNTVTSFLTKPKRPRLSIEEEHSNIVITASRITMSLPIKNDTSASKVLVGGSGHLNAPCGGLSQALVTAIKCWHLLHSYEQLRTEFVRLLDGLKIQQLLVTFNMDVLIYEGRLVEAEDQLKHALDMASQAPFSTTSHINNLTLNLKLASVLFTLNKFSVAAEVVLEIIQQIGPLTSQGGLTPDLVEPLAVSRRHLHLLALTKPQCLQFAATLLIQALRHLVIVEERPDDLCIGHLIVLSQYEWPLHEGVFEEVLEVIKKKGGFSYQFFSEYVINATILEKFMYLATNSAAGFNLDILPLSHSSSKLQRISTRGADRGSKQDFKVAMRKQIIRSAESVESNIMSFLSREKAFIPHVFI